MAKEVYDLKTAFRPYADGDDKYDILPDRAVLSFESADGLAEWVREAGILGRVRIDPPSIAVIEPSPGHSGRQWDIQNFPPSGPNDIYTDGHTNPPSLRELVQVRLNQGWGMSDELKDKLFPTRAS